MIEHRHIVISLFILHVRKIDIEMIELSMNERGFATEVHQNKNVNSTEQIYFFNEGDGYCAKITFKDENDKSPLAIINVPTFNETFTTYLHIPSDEIIVLIDNHKYLIGAFTMDKGKPKLGLITPQLINTSEA